MVNVPNDKYEEVQEKYGDGLSHQVPLESDDWRMASHFADEQKIRQSG